MLQLSVAIVACNEAANIGRVLASVAWADEIVLLDSGSTDDTVAIAVSFGAKIFVEKWRGYGPGVNSALDKCTMPWILNIDADEEVSPQLAENIRRLLTAEPPLNAYTVPRSNLIFGRWMKHGGLYPDRKLRLFRNGAARLREDTEPHATPKTAERVGALHGDLLHYQYPTIQVYLEHMKRYSSASVPLLLRKGKTSSNLLAFWGNTVLRPAYTFFYNYVIRLGFLDGREGLLFHMNHAIYVNWKYAKAWRAAKLAAHPPQPSSDQNSSQQLH